MFLADVNGIDIAIVVCVAIFILGVIGYLIYKKVKFGTIEECDAKSSGRNLVKRYNRQKRKEEKQALKAKEKAEKAEKIEKSKEDK